MFIVTIVEYSYICFEVFTKSQLQNFFLSLMCYLQPFFYGSMIESSYKHTQTTYSHSGNI